MSGTAKPSEEEEELPSSTVVALFQQSGAEIMNGGTIQPIEEEELPSSTTAIASFQQPGGAKDNIMNDRPPTRNLEKSLLHKIMNDKIPNQRYHGLGFSS